MCVLRLPCFAILCTSSEVHVLPVWLSQTQKNSGAFANAGSVSDKDWLHLVPTEISLAVFSIKLFHIWPLGILRAVFCIPDMLPTFFEYFFAFLLSKIFQAHLIFSLPQL